jgi:hypothetical protein
MRVRCPAEVLHGTAIAPLPGSAAHPRGFLGACTSAATARAREWSIPICGLLLLDRRRTKWAARFRSDSRLTGAMAS